MCASCFLYLCIHEFFFSFVLRLLFLCETTWYFDGNMGTTGDNAYTWISKNVGIGWWFTHPIFIDLLWFQSLLWLFVCVQVFFFVFLCMHAFFFLVCIEVRFHVSRIYILLLTQKRTTWVSNFNIILKNTIVCPNAIQSVLHPFTTWFSQSKPEERTLLPQEGIVLEYTIGLNVQII